MLYLDAGRGESMKKQKKKQRKKQKPKKSVVVPVGVGGHTADGSLAGAGLLVGDVVAGARPTAEDHHVLGAAQQHVARLELRSRDKKEVVRLGQAPSSDLASVKWSYRSPGDRVRDLGQSRRDVARLGGLPRHADIAWAPIRRGVIESAAAAPARGDHKLEEGLKNQSNQCGSRRSGQSGCRARGGSPNPGRGPSVHRHIR